MPVQKSFRVETCSELLAIYSANSDNVLYRIVTGDENVDSPLESCHQTGVNAVKARQLTAIQEVSHSAVGWKSWPQFAEIAKVCCWWITFHIRQPWLYPTTVNYWETCVRQLRRNGGECYCWPEVHCCCTTMHRWRAHVSSCTSRSQGHWIWTAVSISTLLTRPGTQRLLPISISTSEEASSWNAVRRRWWTQAGHGVVSRQHASRILFNWNNGTFWEMSQMCVDVKRDYIEK